MFINYILQWLRKKSTGVRSGIDRGFDKRIDSV